MKHKKAQSPARIFLDAIVNKERRKIKARQSKPFGGLWFGLQFTGLVGWSIVAPTLLGLTIGMWIDRHFTSQISWTLALMLAGLSMGCLVAWEWVTQEQERMTQSQNPPNLSKNNDPEKISEQEVNHD